MNKIVKNMFFVVCTVGIVLLIPLFLSHDDPIPVNIARLDAQELAAKKEAALQEEKQVQRKVRATRAFSCKVDDDCIIVDKDPCGCTIGPKGVTAVNVNYIVDFNAINNQRTITTACPEVSSQEKECSPSAHPVCVAQRCKIAY